MAVSDALRRQYEELGLWRNLTLPAWWAEVVQAFGPRTAVVDGQRRCTFSDLDDWVRSVAGGMRAAGVAPGQVIAYQLPNCLELLVVHLAAWQVGAVPLPLYIGLKEPELLSRLAASRAVGLVVPVQFRGRAYASLAQKLQAELPALRLLWEVALPEEKTGATSVLTPLAHLAAPPAGDHAPAPPDEVAQVMFTSGTEGAPKGVLHSHNTMSAFIRSIQTAIRLDSFDVSLVLSPMTLALGLISSSLAPLLVGATVVVHRHFRPDEALQLFEREGVTVTGGTSAHYRSLLDLPRFRPAAMGRLRLAGITGGPVSAETATELMERVGCKVMTRWGMTEGSFTATALEDPAERVTQTCGRCLPGVELQARGQDGRPLPHGSEGVLWVRGPSLFRGYLNDPERTAAAFDPAGWFCTGDIGRIDAEGYLHFMGRQKDIIVRGGMKISPAEVEALLGKHPAVRQSAMVAMPDRRLGERNCLFVVLAPGADLTLAEVVDYLRRCGVAEYKLPERLEVVPELPVTSTLKVRKDELRRTIAAKLRSEAGDAPAV